MSHVTSTSGPAAVLASGTVTTFFGHPLSVNAEIDDTKLTVELAFHETDDGAVGIESVRTPSGWRLDVRNVVDASGRGTATPVLLGTVGSDLVFLHVRVFRFGTTPDHTIHYTLYRAPAARTGAPTPGFP